jgi:hypothetical protein
MLWSKIRKPFSRLPREVTALGSEGVANAEMARVTSHVAGHQTTHSEASVCLTEASQRPT